MLDLHGLLADIPEMKGHAPGKNQEYVNGWGIFALPFESGDVLALRVFPQNDFSPYRALWHRDPSGRWAIYVDGSRLDTACPRYFGSVCEYTGFAGIDVTWAARNSLRIRMTDPSLDWTVTAHSTRVLTFVNAISAKLPLASWRPQTLVRARERMAHRLGMGHIQLNGVMPSGHTGHLMPEQMFFIDEARATLNGADLGRPVRLPSNPTIGEFRLPSRGVLVKGGAVWDVLDPVEYERTRAATGEPRRAIMTPPRGHGTRLDRPDSPVKALWESPRPAPHAVVAARRPVPKLASRSRVHTGCQWIAMSVGRTPHWQTHAPRRSRCSTPPPLATCRSERIPRPQDAAGGHR